jgi:RHS repeat-associated protein
MRVGRGRVRTVAGVVRVGLAVLLLAGTLTVVPGVLTAPPAEAQASPSTVPASSVPSDAPRLCTDFAMTGTAGSGDGPYTFPDYPFSTRRAQYGAVYLADTPTAVTINMTFVGGTKGTMSADALGSVMLARLDDAPVPAGWNVNYDVSMFYYNDGGTRTVDPPGAGWYRVQANTVLYADWDVPPQFNLTVTGAPTTSGCTPSLLEQSCICNPAAGLAGAGTVEVGDPVSTGAGALVEQETDLQVPSRGGGLTVARSYNSLTADGLGALGRGWTSSLDTSLQVDAPSTGDVTIRQPGGAPVVFSPAPLTGGGTGYIAGSWVTSHLSKDGSDWLHTLSDGSTLRYGADGKLQATSNFFGYETTYGYTSGRLSAVTDQDSGRALSLTWNGSGDRIASISDGLRSVTYEYDGGGHLSKVTRPDGSSWEYVYDQTSHLLTRIRHPDQVAASDTSKDVVNTYTNGKVTLQRDNRFSPPRDLGFAYSTSGSDDITTITESSGSDSRVRVDTYSQGRRTKAVQGSGPEAIEHRFTYDQATGGIATVDVIEGGVPRRLTTNSYDAAGNLVATTDAANRTTKATYDSFGRPLTVTDPVGIVTTNTYDTTTKELTSTCTPLGSLPAAGQTKTCATSGVTASQTTFGYDPAKRGDVTWVKDPTRQDANPANAVRYTYGTGGDLTEVLDAGGNKTTFTYDAVGRPDTTVMPKGYVSPNTPAQYTWDVDTDGAGRVTKATDPLGHFTERVFTPVGQVDWEKDGNGNLTDYIYNAGGELIETKVGPAGAPVLTSSTDYDGFGQVKVQRDGAGAETEYVYTATGLLTSVEDPNGRTTSYGYDAAGRMVSKQAPGGNCVAVPGMGCTRYGYDTADQLKTITYSDGTTPNVTDVTYDGAGRRTSMVAGDTWTWGWDSLGRLTSTSEPQIGTTTYGWDLAGRSTTVQSPSGPVVTRGHDSTGRFASSQVNSATTTFAYDANSNLNKITYPTATGTQDTFGFDQADRLMDIQFRRGAGATPAAYASLTYERFNGGELKKVTQSGLPNLPGGSVENYGYDAANRLTSITGSTTRSLSYDGAGNLTKRPDGALQAFDPANQLCNAASSATTCTTPASGATDFDFDGRGNRTVATPDGGLPTALTYDQADRLTTAAVPAASGGDGQYHAITPARLVDTRTSGGPIAWNGERAFTVTGANGIPSSGVAAVVVTVTSVNATNDAFLTVYPTGSTRPGVSTLNTVTGVVVANSTIAKVGTNGQITVFAGNTQSDVIIDIQGWYSTAAGPQEAVYEPLDPARIVDTRSGSGLCQGSCSMIGGGTTRAFTVAGLAGVPTSEIESVVLNVTAVGATLPGFLRVTADGAATGTSSVQYTPGQAPSQMVIVPLSATGTVSVFSHVSSDVLIDVLGFFTTNTDGAGHRFTSQNPVRALDTRTTSPSVIVANATRDLTVVGSFGVPAGATAVAINIASVDPVAGGYMRVFPTGNCGPSCQQTGTVNFGAGQEVANAAIVKVGTGGKISIFANQQTHALVDIVGWFSPDTQTWTYTYDPTGLRRAKNNPDGTTIRYNWDRSGSLPMLLAESTFNASGTLTATTRYHYGPGGLPYAQDVAGTLQYLHHDQLGSTRAITHANGSASGATTISYDAYGTLAGTNGSSTTRLGYAGQYTDPETGYQYLRARYYDPTTGELLTRDPIASVTREPYGYVMGSPLNRVDPTGLAFWDDWCINNPWAEDDCDSIAEQNPEMSQGIVDFASGVLDVNPITATTNALGLSDTSQYADECSGWYRGGQVSMIAAELAMGAGAGRSLFSKEGLEIGASRQIGRSGSRGSWFVRAHVDDAVHRMDDGRLIGRHLQLERWVSGVSNSHKSTRWELRRP